MEPNEISYAELKDLVSAARFLAFTEFKKQEEFSWKLFVYQCFIKAFNDAKYEDLFIIWKGGLEQMEGTNLITVVKELVR
jgi:hypothetical protein